MDDLTDGQRNALHELVRKKSGAEVGFINIADARTLTDLGLARRAHSGWEITPEGAALVSGRGGELDPLVGSVDDR
jgi:hypothetical protein